MARAFAEAVDHAAREVFGPLLKHEEPRQYILDPRRHAEAEAVDRCVQRLADYEIEPPAHGKGVGRFAPASLTPPIGKLIGEQRVAELDGPTRERLRAAIVDATACGYTAMAGLESDGEGFDPRTDVDAKELWRLWIVRLNAETLDQIGVETDFQSTVRNLAADRFTAEMRDLGLLPKVRKRMRYGLVGQWYGQAGMLLRFVQSTNPEPDASADIRQLVNTWPFEP